MSTQLNFYKTSQQVDLLQFCDPNTNKMTTTTTTSDMKGEKGWKITLPHVNGIKTHVKKFAQELQLHGSARRVSMDCIEVLAYGNYSDVLTLHARIIQLLSVEISAPVIEMTPLETMNYVHESFCIHPTSKTVKEAILKKDKKKDFSSGDESSHSTNTLSDHLALEKFRIKIQQEMRQKQEMQQQQYQNFKGIVLAAVRRLLAMQLVSQEDVKRILHYIPNHELLHQMVLFIELYEGDDAVTAKSLMDLLK